MKTIQLIVAFAIIPVMAFTQENFDQKKEKSEETFLWQEDPDLNQEKPDDDIKTLFSDAEHGGFGGVTVRYSEIAGQDAISIGGRGGWIIDHMISIGFGGTGYFNNIQYISQPEELQINQAGGHGGIYLEHILLPRFPVHLSIPLFAGAGGITYIEYTGNWEEGIPVETESYFIAEPGVELEFNMLKYFRLSAGVYYRFTTDISLQNTPANPLEGFNYGITLKFGKF